MDRVFPFVFFLLCWGACSVASVAFGQTGPIDSTYLRISDPVKALEAMRFDLDAYTDTLRHYRDALDRSAYRVNASSKEGEAQQAALGLARRDAQQLAREMRLLRKRLKHTPPPVQDAARACGELVQRTKALRGRLVELGAPPGP